MWKLSCAAFRCLSQGVCATQDSCDARQAADRPAHCTLHRCRRRRRHSRSPRRRPSAQGVAWCAQIVLANGCTGPLSNMSAAHSRTLLQCSGWRHVATTGSLACSCCKPHCGGASGCRGRAGDAHVQQPEQRAARKVVGIMEVVCADR